MAEKLLRGEDYPHLCEDCRKAIDSVAAELELRLGQSYELIGGLVYVDLVDDPEAAWVVAYDRGMLHSSYGNECPE